MALASWHSPKIYTVTRIEDSWIRTSTQLQKTLRSSSRNLKRRLDICAPVSHKTRISYISQQISGYLDLAFPIRTDPRNQPPTFPCSTRLTGLTTNSALPPSPYTEKLQLLASAWRRSETSFEGGSSWPKQKSVQQKCATEIRKRPNGEKCSNMLEWRRGIGPQLWKRPCFYLHDIDIIMSQGIRNPWKNDFGWS